METSERALKETSNLFQCVDLIAAAETPAGIFGAIQEYLRSWPKERIARLRGVDGGWAPFDQSQRPLQINGVLDLCRIADAIHCHCVNLRQAGVPLTPEIVELAEIFVLAAQMAESLKSPEFRANSPAQHAGMLNPRPESTDREASRL